MDTKPKSSPTVRLLKSNLYMERLALADAVERADKLEAALRALVTRCDGAEGVRADGSNIDTCAAHATLGDFKPALEEVVDAELSDEQLAALPVLRVCPHSKTAGECHDCDIAADFAFDAAREDRAFGRR